MQKHIVRVFELSSAITLVLGLAGGALMSGGLLRRIESISRTARNIMAGDFSCRVPVRGTGDEFDHLAASLNAMLERNEAAMESVRQVSNDIAHDLRTPLTRMKLALELLGDDPAVEELKSDVAEMEHMVHGYLDFARGDGAEEPVETDVSLLIEETAAAMRREGAPLLVAAGPEFVMPVRRNGLRRCLTNLIENARRHGNHVWLAGVPVGDGIDILVDDDGPGISPADRDRAFRAFVRLDPSRNPSTGGVGLGLTIARDVARNHGGDVKLETSPQGGLRARVHLPR
jgi:two-component system osmolarity sensor histidine kinase EnvZ